MIVYWQLFYAYTKIGIFGFGGGYAMLSLIQHEVVDKYHWLSLAEFTDVIAISQMTPGPIGINSATYIGYTVTGNVWGAILATVAASLPSFLMVLAISMFFCKIPGKPLRLCRFHRFASRYYRPDRCRCTGTDEWGQFHRLQECADFHRQLSCSAGNSMSTLS